MPTYLWYKKSDFSCRRTDWPTIVTNEGIPKGPRGPTMRSGIKVGFVNLAIDLFSPFHHLLMWIPSMKDVESRWFYRFFGPTALGKNTIIDTKRKSGASSCLSRAHQPSEFKGTLYHQNEFLSYYFQMWVTIHLFHVVFGLHRIIIAVKNILRQNLFECFSIS